MFLLGFLDDKPLRFNYLGSRIKHFEEERVAQNISVILERHEEYLRHGLTWTGKKQAQNRWR